VVSCLRASQPKPLNTSPLLHACHMSGDEIKKNDMGGSCSTRGRDEKCIQHFGRKTCGIDRLEDLGIRGCIQKFPDWPPGARTANGTAFCHYVQLYRYFMSQSGEFCPHNAMYCFSTSVYCCCYRLGITLLEICVIWGSV
jgi:hypothetical protein